MTLSKLTIAQLIERHNALVPDQAIKSWKKAKALLIEKIEAIEFGQMVEAAADAEPSAWTLDPRTVTVIDDTLRENIIGFNERGQLVKQGQREVHSQHEFRGRHLQIAINRAKRFMRSLRFQGGGAPRHIALAMMAFHKADHEGFQKALAGALVPNR